MFRAGNTPFSYSLRPKGPRGSACIFAASGRSVARFAPTAPNPSIVDCNIHHSDNAASIEINDGEVATPHQVTVDRLLWTDRPSGEEIRSSGLGQEPFEE